MTANPAWAAESAAAIPRGATRHAEPARWLIPALAAGVVLVSILGLGLGAVAIAPGQVAAILAAPFGLDLPWSYSRLESSVLLNIRLPRVLLGALTGAGLSLGGAWMQALFRNPLADPGLIGVSSGAAAAAAAFTVLGSALPTGAALIATWGMPAAAVIGGWLMALLVVRLASTNGRVRVDHMLLAGIAINALAGAVIGLLMLIANDAQLREVAFWSFGSLGRADEPILLAVGLTAVPLILAGLLCAPWLNALLLGENEAALIGVPVERLKHLAIALTCLAVGSAVAFTGLIGFVGLVAPHMVRLLIGSDHRRLLPAAALMGAILLPLADVLSRTVAAPVELPIGLVTALLGAPFFLGLLLREQRRQPS